MDFGALGTGVRVLTTSASTLEAARAGVVRELAAIDEACSRFRDDSEVSLLQRAGGREVQVSSLLTEALAASLRAARMTGGAVDPTVGGAMRRIGYDRDFADVAGDGGPVQVVVEAVPGWRLIELDEQRARVRIPDGLELDLGSMAKALAADRAATAAVRAVGQGGVLVSLGGDIAVAGTPPEGGWRVLVTDDHAASLDAAGQVISLAAGGLATSSTTVRRWRRGSAILHHIIDPMTGLPATETWRTVSVVAATCVDANTAATAAIVWGARALDWLARHQLPARLVGVDGQVIRVAGWPEETDGERAP